MGGCQDERDLLQPTSDFDRSFCGFLRFRLGPDLSADGTHSTSPSLELDTEIACGYDLLPLPASADGELATTK